MQRPTSSASSISSPATDPRRERALRGSSAPRIALRAVGIACVLALAGCGKTEAHDDTASAQAAADGTSASGSARAATSASGSDAAAIARAPGSSGSAGASASVAANAPAAGTDPLFRDDAAVVEAFDGGSAAFVVAPDGNTKIALADAQGKPITDRKATMTYGITEEQKTLEVPLQYDADGKYLVAHGPELSLELTPVRYEITGGAKPWTGYLHLPAGGTRALNASAGLAASAHVQPLVGPHGGKIEHVGDDDVEVLMDNDSGEARAWIIVDGRVVAPEHRSFSLVLDERRVDLFPDLNDSFYAKVSLDASFSFSAVHKVSCVLEHDAVVSTLVFGFRPHVLVFAARPAVDVVVVGWTKDKKAHWDKNPNEPGLGWAAGKEKHGDHDHDHDSASLGVGVEVHAGAGDHGHAGDGDHGHPGDGGSKGGPKGAGSKGGSKGGGHGKK